MTEASGVFRFDGLPPGQYALNAQKPQFAFSTGSNLNLQLEGSREGMTLTLMPLSVITGKAVDQEGQPVAHANVIAIRAQVVDGFLQTSTYRSVSTNDLGVYRLWNVEPGKYYVKAAGRSGGTASYEADVPPWYTSDDAFAAVYTGGATTFEAATAVVASPGEEAKADFTLRLEPAYRIRGVLSDFDPSIATKFELVMGDEDVAASRVSLNSNTGRFEIQDAISGNYILRVTQGGKAGEVPVKVPGADVNGVAVKLTPGVDIQVNTKFVGAPPEAEQGTPLRQGLGSMCFVALHPASRRGTNVYNSQSTRGLRGAANAGEMTIHGVPPGAYRAVITCLDGYPAAAVLGTQDLLVNPLLTILPGMLPPALEISAKYGGGSITGAVQTQDGKNPKVAGVLLVPQFAESSGPQMQPFLRNDQDYEFDFGPLAPGNYMLYALSAQDVEFRNPEFLRSLAGGTPVSVQDGVETKVTLAGVAQ